MLTKCCNCERLKINGHWANMKIADMSLICKSKGMGGNVLIQAHDLDILELSHGICPSCGLKLYGANFPNIEPDPDSILERDQRALAYLSTKRR